MTGRFAPSPTGDLHLGSLLAAVGSFLSARASGGRWLVRIEDLDPPRVVPGAADRILRTLEAFGLWWDDEVAFQSHRHDLYEAALARLTGLGMVYPCSCSRAELASFALASDGEPVYPGTCRRGPVRPDQATSIRFRVPDDIASVEFQDMIQGPHSQHVSKSVGDFVIRRKDRLFAYQLAVVVDDASQGVTQVVRGADLLDNTPRQILLQRALGLPQPAYGHLPLVTEPDGSKLAKQHRSVALDPSRSGILLYRALRMLRQAPPEDLEGATVGVQLEWAISHWSPCRLRSVLAVPA